ncbi:NAD(P)H-dependent flavin oxidoreductase [Paracoccaceae bacterium GXU_MW_L88]
MTHAFFEQLGCTLPIIQAPMAGSDGIELAVAVSEAGALGSLGLGAKKPDGVRETLAAVSERTTRPVNVNFFCHENEAEDPAANARWLAYLAPHFAALDATPPETLHRIYESFRGHEVLTEIVLSARPKVVSFHFGLPEDGQIAALKDTGCVLLGSAISLEDAQKNEAAGMDALVLQGFEAGGHRGIRDQHGPDAQLSTRALLEAVRPHTRRPLIVAGGIMDGKDIRAMLEAGADGVQMGTAFLACDESPAPAAHKAALQTAPGTTMTAGISGRPARCLDNAFTALASDETAPPLAPYPYAYDAGKALHAAALAQENTGYGAFWAGTAHRRARQSRAADLVQALAEEMQ